MTLQYTKTKRSHATFLLHHFRTKIKRQRADLHIARTAMILMRYNLIESSESNECVDDCGDNAIPEDHFNKILIENDKKPIETSYDKEDKRHHVHHFIIHFYNR